MPHHYRGRWRAAASIGADAMSTLPSGRGKPTILVVDGDLASLAGIAEEVRARYGRDYHVASESSAQDALARVRGWTDSGQEIALILADQWLPGLSGVELLAAVRQIAGAARRALLIRWGDRSTAGPILLAA